jgi:hypothetical protein
MLTDFQFNAQRLWRICLKCVYHMDTGAAIIDWRQLLDGSTDLPSRGPFLAIARLLLGTAAQESAFQWERQRTPTWDGSVGGFSKWQLETASIQRTLSDLSTRKTRLDNATKFLFADPKATTEWVSLPMETILWMLRLNDNDYLGALLCREHYRRVPAYIPGDLQNQAEYWKKYYNTSAGKGTVDEYIANWNKYCSTGMQLS